MIESVGWTDRTQMSDKGATTGFHVDYSGSTALVLLLEGEKVRSTSL